VGRILAIGSGGSLGAVPEEADCGSLMTLEKVEIIRYRPGQ